jgi:hypothetical protein
MASNPSNTSNPAVATNPDIKNNPDISNNPMKSETEGRGPQFGLAERQPTDEEKKVMEDVLNLCTSSLADKGIVLPIIRC